MARSKDLREFADARAVAAITARDPDFQSYLATLVVSRRAQGPAHPGPGGSGTRPQRDRWHTAGPTPTAAIQSVAAGMASRNPQAAWEWVRSLGLADQPNERACGLVLAEWLKTDAPAAMAACQASGIDAAKLSTRQWGIRIHPRQQRAATSSRLPILRRANSTSPSIGIRFSMWRDSIRR